MIAIIDYDAGNLKSVEKALLYLGEECVVTRDRNELLKADKVILPGVGAFGDAMEKLNKFGLVEVIHEIVKENKPFLGICLGLQLMFESSEEGPGVKGLGLLPGKIVKFPEKDGYKIHASVEHGNIFACQFHPEKSGDVGLQILKNFCEL